MRWQNRAISARSWSSDTECILSQQTASPVPVEKVNHHSDEQPQSKADPGHSWKKDHERHAGEHSEDWNERHPGRFERARTVRFAPPQNPDSDTHENKCEQRSDIRQIDHFVDTREHGAYAHRNARENRGDVRRPES